MIYDALIAGAGPAGATCAAFCAQAGLRVLVLEREEFPREKVCGDCLNPLCWPVLDRMGAAETVMTLAHSKLRYVEIATMSRTILRYPLPEREYGEIAVKRSLFDTALANRAAQLGAEIRHGAAITGLERTKGAWRVRAGREVFTARRIVAADGRNSTLARLLGILPPAGRERVALQAHFPAPVGYGEKALLRFLPEGYCGVASIGEGMINLCLVGEPRAIPALQRRAAELGLSPKPESKTGWRTIAPLARAPLPPAGMKGLEGVLLAGDAARVVEPFTGEGIYYALASGELAAAHLAGRSTAAEFVAAHRQLYAGRLWINRLAKLAVLHPRVASALFEATRIAPAALRFLTSRVVGSGR